MDSEAPTAAWRTHTTVLMCCACLPTDTPVDTEWAYGMGGGGGHIGGGEHPPTRMALDGLYVWPAGARRGVDAYQILRRIHLQHPE